MRPIHVLITILLLVLTFLSFSYADDYTRWELPEGAKLRLGKGKKRDLFHGNSFQFSSDSSEFIVFTSIGIWVYDTQTGKEIRLLTGTKDSIPDNLVISPDSQIFACQTDRRHIPVIQLFDFHTGKLQNTLEGHLEEIESIDFSPDSQMLVSGDDDGKLVIWNISSGQHRRIHTSHDSISGVQFSPNGVSILSSHWGEFLLWNVETGKLVSILKGTDGIETIVYSPDGNLLVGTNDAWIRLWDAETGMIKMTLKTQAQSQTHVIALSPDGKTLANASVNKVELWDLQTQKREGILKGKPEHVKPVHQDDDEWYFEISHNLVSSMIFSPDGRTLALSKKNEIQLWDTVTGEYKLRFRSKGSFGSLIFSPDGRTLAATGYRWDNETGICLFNIDTNDFQDSSLRCFITEHRPEVRSIAFSPDGLKLASGYSKDYIRLWDVSTGKLKQVLVGNPYPLWIQSVTISPDGNTLACLNTNKQSSGGYGQILLWDMTNGKYQKTLKGHGKNIGKYISHHPCSITFSPDSKVIVSGSLDGTVRLWNNQSLANDSAIGKLQGVFSGTRKGILKGHTDQVISVAISPDGQTIASGSMDKTVRIWDFTTQKLIHSLDKHPSGVNCVAFSPDGKSLASSDENGTVYLWDYISGERKAIFADDLNWKSPIYSIAFSPDGNTIAGGRRDVFLWEIDSHQLKTKFTGHNGYIYSVKFSPDGRTLASGSSDGTVLIWDIE